MNQTYFVLKDKESYWNGWHWSPNIKTAKKYVKPVAILKDRTFLNGDGLYTTVPVS